MDELDRKILYVIAENARESHNVLARRIRCSREVFDYRIRKLEEEGIIVKYQARVNISNFIYGGYIVLLKVSPFPTQTAKKYLDALKRDSRTQYIGNIGGDYDYIIGFTVKNLEGLSSYIDLIRDSFDSNIQKMNLITEINELKDSFQNLFAKSNEINNIVSMPSMGKKQVIDEIDKEIILSLGKNSSLPSWRIAEKLGMSDVAIRKRIQKLVETRIILGFRTIMDLTKLNFEPYVLFLKVNFTNSEKEKSFNAFLQIDKRVTYAVKTIGEYDYVIRALFSNGAEFKSYWKELRENFTDLYEIHALPEFETLYHTQLAESFLE